MAARFSPRGQALAAIALGQALLGCLRDKGVIDSDDVAGTFDDAAQFVRGLNTGGSDVRPDDEAIAQALRLLDMVGPAMAEIVVMNDDEPVPDAAND